MIWNDGHIPLDWSLQKLITKHTSKPYNPDIANTFFRAGLIESWGRGISKIIEACVKEGLSEPIFNTDLGGLFVEFTARTISHANTVTKSSQSITNKQKSSVKIIQLIRKNQNITIQELATKIGITTRAVEKQIEKLKAEQKLERSGADNGGKWNIIE